MPLSPSLQQQIDALFSDYDRPDSPGCALGVVLDGEPVYARGYGMADLRRQAPITPDTVFHLASVSKQFTAACIALLEEAGRISLEDAASRYIPYLPDCGRELKLRHLLYMTNGLDDFYDVTALQLGIPEGGYFSQDQAVGIIRAANWLKFPPGARWSYGNTGYFLLARVVEKVSGQPFHDFAKENIFDPLGMEHTLVRGDRNAAIPGRATGYARYEYVHYKDGPVPAELRGSYCEQPESVDVSGAGQVWSTINDLFRWERNFRHNALGRRDPGLARRMTTPGTLNDGTPAPYGYGQFLTRKCGLEVVFHEGGSAGAHAVLYRIPEKRLSVLCLANTNDFLSVMLRKLGEECYERIAGLVSPWEPSGEESPVETDPVAGPARPGLFPPLELESMTGSYEDPENAHIWEVRLEDGRLKVRENFAASFALLPDCDGRGSTPAFRPDGRSGSCTFHREAPAGPYHELLVEDGGTRRTFQRFLDDMPDPAKLREYEGLYRCASLETGYRVTAAAGGVRLENLVPERDLLNVVFTPTIRDMFLARYPPALGWYVLHFRRDAAGGVDGFVFRDEVPGRENWVFLKDVMG